MNKLKQIIGILIIFIAVCIISLAVGYWADYLEVKNRCESYQYAQLYHYFEYNERIAYEQGFVEKCRKYGVELSPPS